jgi:hypothetical protein
MTWEIRARTGKYGVVHGKAKAANAAHKNTKLAFFLLSPLA